MVFSPWKHAIRTLVLNHKYTIPEWFARVISGNNFAILTSSFGLNGLEFNFSIQQSEPRLKDVVCSEAISLCYRPAPKDAGFHFVQATTPLTRRSR